MDGDPRRNKWSIVAHDAQGAEWVSIAAYGFWLRHPTALDADRPSAPKGLEESASEFRRLGNELRVLESDLTQCLNEFKTAHEALYRDPEDLALKKFAIVYHADNFYVRVHKLVENVYGLLALTVGLDYSRRPVAGERSRKESVKRGLERRRFGAMAAALRAFEENQWVKGAVEARNLFVHQYREEPRWPMLAPEGRVREFEGGEDAVGEEIRRLTEADDLDRYANRKAEELLETLGVVREFRMEVLAVLEDEVARYVRKASPEVKKRFQCILDLNDFRHGRGPLNE